MSAPSSVPSLAGLDPRRVPLPHGCEVTLTRETHAEQHVFPQGTAARVTGLPAEGRVEIAIVGRGVVTVDRCDVVPRRDSGVTQAHRRAQVERALQPCTLARATVGSRAWGLASATSDHDTRGVFLWPFSWASARLPPADVVVSADGSHTLWEVGRTITQALRADPNTLEMLFVPDVVQLDPLGQSLFKARDAFVSTKIYGSFGRYALSQSKKLRQSLRLAEHRARVLEWLREDATLSLDALAKRLADAAIGEPDQGVPRAKQYLKQLYRSMSDHGLLAACSLDALANFAQTKPTDLELPRELRPKNAYNLLRIVSCAVQWLRTGEPLIETTGELRDKLLQIKAGSVDLPTALSWTEAEAAQLEEARANSVLPAEPDLARANALLLSLREAAAQRWFGNDSSPWSSSTAPEVIA